MLVENVLINAPDFVSVEIIDAGVKIKRDDWQFVANQDGFRLLKEFLARLQIGLFVCLLDERIVF